MPMQRTSDGSLNSKPEVEKTMSQRQPIIVVVDPDADRATALSTRLDRKGYHVVRRASGIDALECVAECRPDLVLSEVELLDIQSPELLRSICEISPSTQVLFITRPETSRRFPEGRDNPLLGQAVASESSEEAVQAVDRLLEGMPLQESPFQA